MTQPFILSPCYRLDDTSPWLEGIDPSRHYWVNVNGDSHLQIVIPGLNVSSKEELRDVIMSFRAIKPGEKRKIERVNGKFTLHCVSANCYAIEYRVMGALTWHLFDKETVESLLMASHPDWIPSPKDVELGRNQLERAFMQPAYAA